MTNIKKTQYRLVGNHVDGNEANIGRPLARSANLAQIVKRMNGADGNFWIQWGWEIDQLECNCLGSWTPVLLEDLRAKRAIGEIDNKTFKALKPWALD